MTAAQDTEVEATTGQRPVTMYGRPGCGFCHILRRELDRAGIERTEINIWQDPAAAAVVRGHARGNETVPTVIVGNLAMVNPTATEVITALESRRDPAVDARRHGRGDADASPWLGVLWSVALCAAWAGLALANPTTTYHLAPIIALLAWPLFARTGSHRASWRPGLLSASGATALVAVTTGLLLSRDALAGPGLIGPNAGAETAVLTMAAAVIAVALARPGSRTAHSAARAPGQVDDGREVTVIGSGGGCTTGSAGGEGDQCVWTPPSPNR